MMKKTLLLAAMALCIAGCSGDAAGNALVFLSKTGCKSMGDTRAAGITDAFQESVSYYGTQGGCLMLVHVDACFACETEVNVSVTVKDGVISIVEKNDPVTNCVCPYDLTMKIGPLSSRTYQVEIYKSSPCSTQQKRCSFSIDYKPSLQEHSLEI
jgi:hypothetical protein